MSNEQSRFKLLQEELKVVRKEQEKLRNKEKKIIEEINQCPVLYEIWLDSCDSSMTMHSSPNTLKERYINKDKAYARLEELNNGCNYGNPYYIVVSELNG